VSESQSKYELKAFFQGSLLSYLVGIYIFAFYLELHLRLSILQAIRFQFLFGAIIGAMCLYRQMNGPQIKAGLTSVTKTTFLLIFILGIYTVFSMDQDESIRVYNDRVIKFALLSFFIYAATNTVEDLRVIIGCMLLAWLKMGSEGFLGWYTGSLVWENQGIPRLHGSTAMFGHPNSYSGFAVGCLPFAIFLLMAVKSNLLRLGLVTLIAFSLLIIVVTGSRTGYVAVVIGAAYFFFTLKAGKMKTLLLVSATLLATINFVPDEYKERFASIYTGKEKEGRSSETRLVIIQDALEMYAHYPLGVGVQAFSKVRMDMFGRFQNTHNLYLEVLTNIGPIGFIVFFVFVYKLVKQNVSNISRIRGAPFAQVNRTFLTNISKAVIGFILVRLLLGLFGMDLYEIYWWIALGIALAINKLIERSNMTANEA
jgi:putative inorganic carbon (hco3(-)) transporter